MKVMNLYSVVQLVPIVAVWFQPALRIRIQVGFGQEEADGVGQAAGGSHPSTRVDNRGQHRQQDQWEGRDAAQTVALRTVVTGVDYCQIKALTILYRGYRRKFQISRIQKTSKFSKVMNCNQAWGTTRGGARRWCRSLPGPAEIGCVPSDEDPNILALLYRPNQIARIISSLKHDC